MRKDRNDSICVLCDSKLSEFFKFRADILRSMIDEENLTIKTETTENVTIKTEIPEIVKVEINSDFELDYPSVEEHLEESLTIKFSEGQSKKGTSSQKKKTIQEIFCQFCPDGKAYSSKYTLQRHMQSSHRAVQTKKERFPRVNLCSICAKLISNGKRGLEYHVSSRFL